MKQRIITAIIFACLFFPGIFAGGIYFYCLSLIITFVSTYELMNMFYKKNESLRILRYIVPVFSTGFYCLVNYACTKDNVVLTILDNELNLKAIDGVSSLYGGVVLYLFAFFIAVIVVLGIAIASLFFKNPGRTAINSIFSFVYGGVIMTLALNVEYIIPIETENSKLLFSGATFGYLYLVVCFSDMFAYFTGYLFGKHKLCPSISPKKTVEGAIGGTVMASVFGTLAAWIFGVMPIDDTMTSKVKVIIVIVTFIISLLISIVSQFGDLFASVLKREYEIKDYGNILPGHGGVLDRFDSTALAGAFFFVIVKGIAVILMIGILF